MNEAESDSFKQELVRINFRRDMLSLPGGPEWLLHISRLFGPSERILGPGNFGLPDRLRVMMHRLGW